MPISLKAASIVAGVLALVIGGAALAFYGWWQTKGADIVATLGDGTRYGTGKDRQACVTEAVLRVKRGGGLVGFYRPGQE